MNRTPTIDESSTSATTRDFFGYVLPFTLGATLLTFLFSWAFFPVLQNRFASILEIWTRWDAAHYQKIARVGYEATGPDQNFIAFFPLYPALVAAVNALVRHVELAALVVSNLLLIVASALLYQVTLQDFGREQARRSVYWMLLFPTAYFLHAGYTESLFLAVSLASILCARKGHWIFAGIFGALAGLSRPHGIILVPVLFVEYLTQNGWNRRSVLQALRVSAVASLGMVIYLGLNYELFGDPLKFLELQSQGWSRKLAFPTEGFLNAWAGFSWRDPSEKVMTSGSEIAACLLGLLASVLSIRRLRPSYTLLLFLGWALVAFNSFWVSQPRHLLCSFPLFILMATELKSEVSVSLASITCLLIQVVYLSRYLEGAWAF